MVGRIFINYRHDDSPGTAGRICDRLKEALGPENLFIDADIPKGADFEKYLNDQLGQSCVFLAVLGPNWLDVCDGDGHRRLDTANDWVRVEIATALSRDIRVIPILIDNALMPDANALPSALRPLTSRQAIRVRNSEFDQDFGILIDTLRESMVDGELNGDARANGSRASNLTIAIQGKKFQELIARYLTRERRLGVVQFVVAMLILILVTLFLHSLPNGLPRIQQTEDAAAKQKLEDSAAKPKLEDSAAKPFEDPDIRAAESLAKALQGIGPGSPITRPGSPITRPGSPMVRPVIRGVP